jgi:DNA-binding YbaB/EbfC family protein
MGKMGNMMKQVQKMQTKLLKVQEEIGQKTVEATAGGGVVTVLVSGNQEVVKVEIKPEVVDPEDIDMLQDLIVAAVNEGLRKAKEMMETELGKVTAGLNLPPGLF